MKKEVRQYYLVWLVIMTFVFNLFSFSAGQVQADSAVQPNGVSFGIEIDGQPAGYFPSCTGMGSESEVVEHAVVDLNGRRVVQKIPGRLTWNQIVLERAISSNQEMWEWRKQVEDGDIANARKNISVIMYDNAQEVAKWNLENAWPSKINTMISSSGIVTEEIQVVYETMKREGVTAQLSKPVKPVWVNQLAVWLAVDDENNGYQLQLYKDGTADGTAVDIPHGADLRYDFSARMTTAGNYRVTVTVKGTGDYMDSEPSEWSEPRVIVDNDGKDGQAQLPAGTTDLQLGEEDKLDLGSGVQNAGGGRITVGGQAQDMSRYSGGGLHNIDLTAAQTVGGKAVQVGKGVRLESGTEGQPITLSSSGLAGVSAAIPDGTAILAPAGWDGTLAPPKIAASTGTAPSGFSVGNTVIEVGAANAILLFDQPVILTLPGVTGTVGYKPAGSDSWVQITQLAGGTYANPAAPAFPGEAYISNGTDTKIITWHFTSFAGLSAQNVPSAGSSGNSGGSSPSPEENTDAASRLSGQNRYQTARRIAEQYCQGFTANVVLASGNGFADALSAGVLAHQLDAPILLVDSTAEGSTEALDYMDKHLEKTGTVTIIGGESAVGAALKDQLNRMGYTRINQIGGQDRYDTANRLYQELDVVKGTPVVISSGEDYPDALAISSFAAYNEWPVLLVRKDELPEAVRQLLLAGQPSNIYLTGGTGAIASDVEKQIQSILPKAEIVRFAGQDRWDTAARIAQTFAPNSQNIYLASGYGFADALAGSVLAAKKGDPIILVNPDLTEVSSSTGSYLNNLPGSEIKITAFGGPAVISDTVFKKIREILNHKP